MSKLKRIKAKKPPGTAVVRSARSQLIKRLRAIGRERDALRELGDDIDALRTSCDDAMESLHGAIDALSRYA